MDNQLQLWIGIANKILSIRLYIKRALKIETLETENQSLKEVIQIFLTNSNNWGQVSFKISWGIVVYDYN